MTEKKLPRIVLDTNVLIAALRSRNGASNEVFRRWTNDTFTLHFSLPLFLQYREVTARHQAALIYDEAEVVDTLAAIAALAKFHKIHYLLRPVLPDPGDDMVLEAAFAARADAIVTYNIRHFTGARDYGIEVATPIQFLRMIGAIP
jgi:putative PIN family toxin of toxin-antitoxin system